jgi:hypothetical protein
MAREVDVCSHMGMPNLGNVTLHSKSARNATSVRCVPCASNDLLVINNRIRAQTSQLPMQTW